MSRAAGPIAVIAQRDLMKFLRDGPRLVATFVLPFLLVLVMGQGLRASLDPGFDFLPFIFTGVLAQTLFQSAAQGIVSLLDDRENDFTQEIFVAPVSRYAIVFGKILGESLVALAQGVGIVAFAVVVGVRLGLVQAVALAPAALAVCLFGGAFGVALLSAATSRRLADQLFNFILLPQFFLAGVFFPIRDLPPALEFFSRIAPMRYAVDLTRAVFYAPREDYGLVVPDTPLLTLSVIAVLFAVFLVVGTALFVRGERNR